MVTALWGEEKSGKTTLALTFPKPIKHFDLDVGGFDRAKHRFTEVLGTDISSKPYTAPITFRREKGTIIMKSLGKIEGYRQLWSEITDDYATALEDPNVATVVIDSATQLWVICHRALLQEKQESQGAGQSMRESLLSIEYGPANEAMRNLIYFARGKNKNLVLTHYPRFVYAQKLTDKGIQDYRTEEEELDGFKQTKALVDLILRTAVKSINKVNTPTATITTSGVALELLGMEFIDPTWDKIEGAIKMVRGES